MQTHKILDGETFWTLHQHYGCQVDEIKAANPDVIPDQLYAGQVVNIPQSDQPSGTGSGSFAYKVVSGDTLNALCHLYGWKVDEVVTANPHLRQDQLHAGQVINIPRRGESDQPSTTAIASKPGNSPPKHSRRLRGADDAGVSWFAQPDTHWCPWKSNTCTNHLIIPGQGTVEIMQRRSVPFELRLSNKNDPHDATAYTIVLSVDKNQVTLGTNNEIFKSSTEPHHVLQPDDGNWHSYWISWFKEDRNVKYGIGEIRPYFSILNGTLDEKDLPSIREIFYLHIKLNNDDRMLHDLSDKSEDFRFYFGKEPVTHDLPLSVIPQNEFNLEHEASHTGIPPSKLEKPCRDLYNSIINFTLNTVDFLDFTKAIERSVRDPNGWCAKKLNEKANRFGQPNPLTTYLRITVGQREGRAPGHAYVIEVWPPEHHSPIHNHSNAYGIIRVLYGRLLLKLYPALTLNVDQYSPIEQILDEDQVTWLLPKLNQTHQVKNPDSNGQCCITIQCYQYGQEDREHYEYFDYIANNANNGRTIGHFDPVSDMDYTAFKNLMQHEWETMPH